MKLYRADRYGLISSADIAHALRRAVARQREEEGELRAEAERGKVRAARRRGLFGRVRSAVAPPPPPASASV